MADQDLNLKVTATATGDGLRKTAEEVKALNAETAKSAPLAAEAKSREEQIAAVRERHAEAARQQAAAEADLDAKRAASPFFNGQAPAIAGPPAEGGGAGDSLLGVGVAGGLAGAAATAATMLAKEAIDGLMNITTRMEEARMETEKMTAELMKQSTQWLAMAQEVNTRRELLGLQKEQRGEIEQTREAMYALERSSGSWVDKMKEWSDDDGRGSWTAELLELITTKREADIERLKEQREAQEAVAAVTDRTARRHLADMEAIDKLSPDAKMNALGEALMEMQVRQGGFLKDSEGWNQWAVRMEDVEKRMKAVSAEIEKGNEAQQREGELLDANMRKEGEKFAQAEKAREREQERAAQEKERLQRAGDAIEDAMERERQRNAKEDAREAEKAQREQQKTADRDARDRARIEDEESRYRTKFNIPPPGFLTPSAPKSRTLDPKGRMPELGTPTDFGATFQPRSASAAPDSSAANAALVGAAEQVRDTVLSAIKAQAKAAAVLSEVKSQSEIHS